VEGKRDNRKEYGWELLLFIGICKKYPGVASGIIMARTPVNSNGDVAKKHHAIFQKTADKKRKLILKDAHR